MARINRSLYKPPLFFGIERKIGLFLGVILLIILFYASFYIKVFGVVFVLILWAILARINYIDYMFMGCLVRYLNQQRHYLAIAMEYRKLSGVNYFWLINRFQRKQKAARRFVV